jgi:glucan-binding YG repeat protein
MKKQTKLGLVLAAAAVISVSVASLVSAKGWVQQGADWYYVNNDGEYVTDTIQSSGNSKFYLGENGAMQRDYFLEDYNEQTYYFGQNGAMVTNTWVAVESSRVSNTDDYIPDNYWYYFQASGKAMKGNGTKGKKATIDGKKYLFNEYGQMATGWFGEDGKTFGTDEENPFTSAAYYGGGDNDGVLRTGWLTYYDGYDSTPDIENAEDYTNLYFYFNPSNCRKTGMDSDGTANYVTKKINGRTYAFANDGVMISGWDVFENSNNWNDMAKKVTYFSGEDDGHQVKKGWVYAVPSGSIDSDKHDDDEEVYMYFLGSGDSVKDQFKKINGKWYCFDHKGIMKTGIVIWCPGETAGKTVLPWSNDSKNGEATRYVDKLDLDYAEGADIAKWGLLQTDADQFIRVDDGGRFVSSNYVTRLGGTNEIRLHLFGDDGARKTGSNNNVEFSDGNYTFASTTGGNYASDVKQKKYYSLGILLKADQDIRYGIYNTLPWVSTSSQGDMFEFQSRNGQDLDVYEANLEGGVYRVLTTSGALQKGNNGAKKDADGNYWLIDKENDNSLRGIWDREVNFSRNFNKFQTKTYNYYGGLVDDANYNICSATVSACTSASGYIGFPGSELASLGNNWAARINDDGDRVYFEYVGGNTAIPGFKSDYGDKEKYIPMGLKDNAGYTISMNFYAADAHNADGYDWLPEAEKYLVKPNNDYFLNCLWYSSAAKYTY